MERAEDGDRVAYPPRQRDGGLEGGDRLAEIAGVERDAAEKGEDLGFGPLVAAPAGKRQAFRQVRFGTHRVARPQPRQPGEGQHVGEAGQVAFGPKPGDTLVEQRERPLVIAEAEEHHAGDPERSGASQRRGRGPPIEDFFHPTARLVVVPTPPPEQPERPAQVRRRLPVLVVEVPAYHLANVAELGFQPGQCLRLSRTSQQPVPLHLFQAGAVRIGAPAPASDSERAGPRRPARA